jgi:hypothetical protein
VREREWGYINRVCVNRDGWRVGLGGKWAGASCNWWALYNSFTFDLGHLFSLSLSLSPVCFWRTGNQSDFSQGNDWNSPSFLNFCSLLRAFVSLSWFGLVYFNLNSALVLVLPCALKFGHL